MRTARPRDRSCLSADEGEQAPLLQTLHRDGSHERRCTPIVAFATRSVQLGNLRPLRFPWDTRAGWSASSLSSSLSHSRGYHGHVLAPVRRRSSDAIRRRRRDCCSEPRAMLHWESEAANGVRSLGRCRLGSSESRYLSHVEAGAHERLSATCGRGDTDEAHAPRPERCFMRVIILGEPAGRGLCAVNPKQVPALSTSRARFGLRPWAVHRDKVYSRRCSSVRPSGRGAITPERGGRCGAPLVIFG